jgi:hypothetical protein
MLLLPLQKSGKAKRPKLSTVKQKHECLTILALVLYALYECGYIGKTGCSKPVVLEYRTLESVENWSSYRRKSVFQALGSTGEWLYGDAASQFIHGQLGRFARHFDISHIKIDKKMAELSSKVGFSDA